ncbi:hypothetical protein CONPUDRAFT_140224 [Coniophora puteana RWD-64-598 SS2]|uniref:Uncharacterized protein n=1 Tax=Coniophora puteana (strain RWD-64-598) TaxID=741705 RepID=A0A5M3M7B5_CONPW|nr:uncharacterized protein CONPUDRAFT_140224 [Coniophora puteana RWD-64-598 SS2]EIW74744.1 hypothetical protein CONPUDRAFT_140224 [Coniophora puteana RWD-64-598 SS2]
MSELRQRKAGESSTAPPADSPERPPVQRFPPDDVTSQFLAEHVRQTPGSTGAGTEAIEVYITHIDNSSASSRRWHFATLAFINTAYTFLILRRLWGAYTRYGLAYLVHAHVLTLLHPYLPGAALHLRPALDASLAGHAVLDLFLLLTITPRLYTFATRIVPLRLAHGFPSVGEPVFRTLSAGSVTTLIAEAESLTVAASQSSAAATSSTAPISKAEKRDKALGALLLAATSPEGLVDRWYDVPGEDWDVDWRAVRAALLASEEGRISMQTWSLGVWMRDPVDEDKKPGWVRLERSALVDSARAEAGTATGASASLMPKLGLEHMEWTPDALERLKNVLIRRGKPQVYHRLIEIAHRKTHNPDGSTKELTGAQAMELDAAVEEVFRHEGLDIGDIVGEVVGSSSAQGSDVKDKGKGKEVKKQR